MWSKGIEAVDWVIIDRNGHVSDANNAQCKFEKPQT